MNLKKKKKGFTLIELMAVIAIIAILAAVLVPTVSGYINRSKKSAIITQVRNVIAALETYNATASNPILETATVDEDTVTDNTITVLELANEVGTDILDANSIGKLGNMQIGTAKLINANENAITDIGIYPDGVFGSYKSLKVDHSELVTKKESDGNGGTIEKKEPKYSQDKIKK